MSWHLLGELVEKECLNLIQISFHYLQKEDEPGVYSGDLPFLLYKLLVFNSQRRRSSAMDSMSHSLKNVLKCEDSDRRDSPILNYSVESNNFFMFSSKSSLTFWPDIYHGEIVIVRSWLECWY